MQKTFQKKNRAIIKKTDEKKKVHNMTQIDALRRILDESRTLCVFTGAGISCPSGIPDFRSENGLYRTSGGSYAPEEIISHSFFWRTRSFFYAFYKEKCSTRTRAPERRASLLRGAPDRRAAGRRRDAEYRRPAPGGGQPRGV